MESTAAALSFKLLSEFVVFAKSTSSLLSVVLFVEYTIT